MQKTRKNLKSTSIVVLALAGLSLINLVFEIFFGDLKEMLKTAPVPEGAPANIVLSTQIFVLAVAILHFLPNLYIGFKGIKLAKNPDDSKAHIIWGIIVTAFTALSLGAPISALVQGTGSTLGNVAEICSIVVDITILFEYVRLSINLRKQI